MAMDKQEIKKDRLRYTKNKTSANLTYLAILFNVLYFVEIYSSDVNNYYYTITIGISVVYNLMFLLIAFLSSEGLKNYKLSYAFAIIAIGVMQIVRILGIPKTAHSTLTAIDGVEALVMDDKQYMYVIVCLIISAAAAIAAGLIGVYKSTTLTKYMKEKGLE